MIAKLEFNLPEETDDHLAALRGMSYKIALENMDNYLRNRLKYEDNLSEEGRIALLEARENLARFTLDAEE